MKKMSHLACTLAIALASTSVFAGTPPLPNFSEDELAPLDADTQEYYRWQNEFLHSLSYQDGVIELPGGKARLYVPTNYYYLSPKDAERVLVEAWGNVPSEQLNLGMLFPSEYNPTDELAWGVTINYDADGHVSDKDAYKIDYDDLMKGMKKDTVSENEWRLEQGYGSIELLGWAAQPYYDESGKKLHWAKELRFDDSENTTLNYNIRVLGREGVLILNFIAGMSQLEQVENSLSGVLEMPTFTEGNTYADFDPSVDKIAAYGIGGLIAGKVLLKTGLLATAFVFLKKFGIILVLGVVAFFRKLFNRESKN